MTCASYAGESEKDADSFFCMSPYRDAKGPILAYCRTGTRSISLWALTEAKTLDTDAVLSATKQAGYDLSAMRSQLLGRSVAATGSDTGAEDQTHIG